MNSILIKQLALDYCCDETDVSDRAHHFTVYCPMEGRRRFDDPGNDCFLKIAVVRGKLLVTGNAEIVRVLQDRLSEFDGAWFLEAAALRRLDEIIGAYGYRIRHAHPFYTADKPSAVDTGGFDIVWYDADGILSFRNDERFKEAFAFSEYAPDVIGVCAMSGGEILGMAGASADSPYLWQIGINVMPGYESKGIGSTLVTLLKNEILRRGVLPYYGTAASHMASQRVALKAGFLPAFAEVITERTDRL